MDFTKYKINIDAIINYICKDSDDKVSDTEITYIYGKDETTNEFDLINKQIREVKGTDNTSKETMRYDLIKTFLDTIRTASFNENGDFVEFGDYLAFNTLVSMGIIVEN